MAKIKLTVEVDFDPVEYAVTYDTPAAYAEAEATGYIAQALQGSLDDLRAVGDRRTWIRSLTTAQEV